LLSGTTEHSVGCESEREFKVLSLDGGGIRGLYTACVLREIEAANGSVAEHFDLLCGTSTGGLIALALASGKTAAEIADFYEEWGPRIFPTGRVGRLWRSTIRLIWKGKYADKTLRGAVNAILRTTLICEANSYLLIPAINITTAKPWVFKTDHDVSLTRDSNLLMADAAMFTSAAPFYFPVATSDAIPGGEYIDGGLWANDPSLMGLTEALRFFAGAGKPFDSVAILSIPPMSPAIGYSVGKRRARSLLTFGRSLANVVLEAQQVATRNYIAQLKDSLHCKVNYFRLPPPAVPKEMCKHVGLDIATRAAINCLKHSGYSVGQEYNRKSDITRFFTTKTDKPIFCNGGNANG